MKLKYDGEMIDIGGEVSWVPMDADDFRGVLHLNETAVDIMNLLKEETTEDTVVAEMQKLYSASEEDIRRNVKKVIDHLRGEGLLAE